MFTDKTPALNVTGSHPGAWLDLGSVINVPESEGVTPSGHRLPGLRAARVIQCSLPWEYVWIGEVCGARPGWAAHPATGGASGEARGQRACARVRTSRPWAGLLLALRLLCSDPGCSSINACSLLLLSRPLSYDMKSDQGKKCLLCQSLLR